MKITDLPIAVPTEISENGPAWSCSRCGETWFRVERQIKMPAQGWLTTAPGYEPEASAVRTILHCTSCGQAV